MKWTVSGVLKRYGGQYLRQFGESMTAQQKKVLRAVMACREESLGTVRYRCVSCGNQHSLPRSCCNRHCAACGHDRVQSWLKVQQDRLLPCSYFLITFTVPSELRAAIMAHPREAYTAMMGAAAETLKESATNARHVGVKETGFIGVLHTWGRDLSYHPHVHFLVPAGGFDSHGQWVASRVSVFVPEQILAVLFRNKLRDRLRGTACFSQIDPSQWDRTWTVDSTSVGNGKAAMTYLAPYVIRGAVSNWRVDWCDGSESLDQAMCRLQVKRSGTHQYRGMPLSVRELIRRWLHHVLPAGLHRVRHYGFLHRCSTRSIEELRLLIAVSLGMLHYLLCSEQLVMRKPPAMQCTQCGGLMISLGYFPPSDVVSTGWLDYLCGRAPPEEVEMR